MQVRRNRLILQGQDDLDQAGHAGRGLQMTDIALHRADKQRVVSGVARGKDIAEGAHLYGIAQCGSRAMRLDVTDLIRRHSSIRQSLTNHLLLGGTIGHGQTAARTILVDSGPAYLGTYPILGGIRVRQAFEHDDATSLPAAVPVRGCVKGLASAVR